jgi:hypothetical protein
MLKRNQARGQTLCSAAALCCIALAPLGAGAQTRMSVAEATQLYTAAGFRIVNNQPVNRCGKPAKPRVTYVDINGDKRPEALFIDADAGCYAPSGRYFAVVTKDGVGWRSVISGTGAIKALSTRTAGWLDMRTTDVGCERPYRYDGRVYTAVTDCSGQTIAVAPPPAQQAQAQRAQAQPPQAAPARPATHRVASKR